MTPHYHLSHLFYHLSHLFYHLSHLFYHLSHRFITFHTYLSPVTPVLSPFTLNFNSLHLWHLTCTLAPIFCHCWHILYTITCLIYSCSTCRCSGPPTTLDDVRRRQCSDCKQSVAQQMQLHVELSPALYIPQSPRIALAALPKSILVISHLFWVLLWTRDIHICLLYIHDAVIY